MPKAGLDVADQPEDLRLDRHVERRGRLVGEKDFRIVGDRDGDHDPLAHAAGELVRVLVEAVVGLGNADEAEELDGAAPRLRAARPSACRRRTSVICRPMRHRRVQRGHRVLEDHRDGVAADGGQGLVGGADEVAGRGSGSRRAVTSPGGRGDRPRSAWTVTLLPLPLSPTIGEHLAAGEREADVAHGVDVARVGVEDDARGSRTSRMGSISAGASGRSRRGGRRRSVAATAWSG